MKEKMMPTIVTPREGLTRYEFPNGVTVSVAYHDGAYATRIMRGIPSSYEIAVMDKDGQFIPLCDTDDVVGYQDTNTLEFILNVVAAGKETTLINTF